MRLNDLRSSSNVDDRRGRGGGIRLAGGGGLAIVGIALLAMLFGVDPNEVLNSVDTGAPTQTEGGTGPRSDDAALAFSRKIIGSAEDVWKPLLERKGATFTPATFTVYDYATPTSCGQGVSSVGPFYCPGDNHIYIDLSFFNELKDKFGAPGEFAQAYVIAHEYGHHIQNLLGTSDAHSDNSPGADSDSVRTELQADCYAGVWAKNADTRFHILEGGDIDDGLRAAAAVGDDTLEKESQGYAVPDSFTHGTSAQRTRWFKRGLDSGNPDSCDTFGAASL